MNEKTSIGILGGGQLGAMLIASAVKLGLTVSVLDKDENAPCSRYTSEFTIGNPMDYMDVVAFGSGKDIIIIEKEAVNADALKWLSASGVKVYPAPETIEIIQNKYLQKQLLKTQNIPVADGVLVNSKSELKDSIASYPVCLKLCSNGYDGKGVMILNSEADIPHAFDEPCVVEKVIDIQSEIAIIVARNASGIVKYYEPVEMHYNSETHMLDYQLCPANVTHEQYQQITGIALQIAEITSLVGIMAIEMFIDKIGNVVVNELAPRPHNSGHHTIETTPTSQFEQYIRAVLNLPLGDTGIKNKSIMLNVISNEKLRTNVPLLLNRLLLMEKVYIHWYGKSMIKNGRKVGHITIESQNLENAMSKAMEIKKLIQ